jgi:hypothetical protein
LANSPPVTVDPGGRLQLTVQETGDVFSVTVSVGQATQINLGGSVVNMDAESVVELVVMKGPNGEPDFTKVAFHVAAGTVTVGGQQLNSQSGAGFVSENAFTPDPAAAELLRAHALPSGQQPTFVPPIIEDVPKSPAAQ